MVPEGFEMSEAVQLDIESVTPARKTRGSKGKAELVVSTPAKQVPTAAMTPMEMLNAAIERGADLDTLERLMDLNDRWEKSQAKKAYIEAKAAFKANAPRILKDKENKQYNSRYASIGNVVEKANEALSKHGLDASWDFEQGERIKVTCTLRHLLGHAESVSLSAPPDNSGAKNPLQQIKSTLTYLKLATFEAVTGIATQEGNLDDDGNASGEDQTISEEQVTELVDIAEAVGADRAKFCRFYKIDSFADIRTSQFAAAKKALLAKGAPK
jgi:hypothetical protein